MKRIQTERTASQRAAEPRRGRTALIVLILLVVLTIGTTASAAVLGGSLSRFSQRERHVIALAPEGQQLRAVGTRDAEREQRAARPTPTESPAPTDSPTAPPRAAQENSSARTTTFQGDFSVRDGVQSWSTKTQVDLFKESYNDTVKAANGDKVIAPGASNYYAFTLENNSNYPMGYTISLKVAGYGTETDVPLEWRLLAGDGATVSDWRGYSEAAEVMERATLAIRRQSNYMIEWRWGYERGAEADRTDTELGNRAVDQLLGAEATIIVNAEQSSEPIPDVTPKPGGGIWPGKPYWPKTGDESKLGLYALLMTISGGGLLILFQSGRRRKKKE